MAAVDGQPAAAHAVEVVRDRGGSLQGHVSRRITPKLVEQADVIVAMTQEHAEILLAHVPEAAPRIRLLHPHGGDVDDPIGSDRETYRLTAESIEEYLEYLLADLGL
jgi:protein-tyrosine phosphatase